MHLAGHVLRLPHQGHPKRVMQWTSPDEKWKTGRPYKILHQTFQEDLQVLDIKWEESEYIIINKIYWRKLAVQCAQMHRLTQILV